MELAIAQFWSSGVGSHDTTNVVFEVKSFVYTYVLLIRTLSRSTCRNYSQNPCGVDLIGHLCGLMFD